MSSPKVVFVFGAPGSGKTTQILEIAKSFGWFQLNIETLLQDEAKKKTSLGLQIDALLASNSSISENIIYDVLISAINSSTDRKFLIEDLPISQDYLDTFLEKFSDVSGLIILDVQESISTTRLQSTSAASGNAQFLLTETRINKYKNFTLPIITSLEAKIAAPILRVDASGTTDEVFESLRPFFLEIEATVDKPSSIAVVEEKTEAVDDPNLKEKEAEKELTMEECINDKSDDNNEIALKENSYSSPDIKIDSEVITVAQPSDSAANANVEEKELVGGEEPKQVATSEKKEEEEEEDRKEEKEETVQGEKPPIESLPPAADTSASEDISSSLAAIKGMLVVCGPSGVGKGTLIGALMSDHPDSFGFSVSHTTRAPRPGEVDGKHYHFSNRDTILAEVSQGKFLEYADVHGNVYGTSLRAVADVGRAGKLCVLDIDVQGARKVRTSAAASKAKFIFIAPPSQEELEQRLRGRGTETEEKIQLRLGNAAKEMAAAKEPGLFDVEIVNGNFEASLRNFKQVIRGFYEDSISAEALTERAAEEEEKGHEEEEEEEAQKDGKDNNNNNNNNVKDGKEGEEEERDDKEGMEGETGKNEELAEDERKENGGDIATSNQEVTTNKIMQDPPKAELEQLPTSGTATVRQYLESTVMPVLRQALRALSTKRPNDPLQFLADFIVRQKGQEQSS